MDDWNGCWMCVPWCSSCSWNFSTKMTVSWESAVIFFGIQLLGTLSTDSIHPSHFPSTVDRWSSAPADETCLRTLWLPWPLELWSFGGNNFELQRPQIVRLGSYGCISNTTIGTWWLESMLTSLGEQDQVTAQFLEALTVSLTSGGKWQQHNTD